MTLSKTIAAGALALLLASPAAMAKKPEKPAATPKSEYNFKLGAQPTGFGTYATAVYPYVGSKVVTLQNRPIADLGKPIFFVVFNPSGASYTSLTRDKKGLSEALVYDPRVEDRKLEKISTKRYGYPTAATYTPDARFIVLATNQGIFVMDQREFKPQRQIKSQFTPTFITMSPNAYYLALTDGRQVEVINYEDGTSRKSFKFDENVNEVFFSDDSSMMGVLTDDGLLEIYETRGFTLKTSVDDLGQGLAGAFNFDGKYVAVATSPSVIEVVNLLRSDERQIIDVPDGSLSQVEFVPDSKNNTLLVYPVTTGIRGNRMYGLEPFYGKLMADEVADKMNEWLKMMPGETMDQYKARVNDTTRAQQQRFFEDEISTSLANNLLSMSAVTLGKYDRANQLLEVDFNNMPSILLPVPENDLQAFTDGANLEFSDAKYGILPNDNFELIYAKVYNKANGQTYLFDNLDRRPLSFMDNDDNVVSLELIQEQQMQEMKLEEIRKEVVEQAKNQKIISDHTNIAVDSRIVPDYNAAGDRILNYEVKFTYDVDPEFSAVEDFGPGKYHVNESGAASSMLAIVKEAFEGDFSQYIKDGKKLKINVYGTADATPINRIIPYDGSYGDFVDEPVKQNGQLSTITVTKAGGIKENPQLAFLRASGVHDYLNKNVSGLDKMATSYENNIDVSQDRGSAHRRITVTFTFVDAL